MERITCTVQESELKEQPRKPMWQQARSHWGTFRRCTPDFC